MCDKCKELEQQVIRLKKERREADRARRVAEAEYREVCEWSDTVIQSQMAELEKFRHAAAN